MLSVPSFGSNAQVRQCSRNARFDHRVVYSAAGTMEAPVQLSSTREAILERIGHTILELSEEVTSEPLPERVVALLDHDRPNPNVMCASVEGLASPGKNGELTIPSP